MRFRYNYDFGDNWRHDMLVERIELLDEEDWACKRVEHIHRCHLP
jgi:hypothetical protein